MVTNYKCPSCNCTAYIPPGTYTVKCSGCGTISSVLPDPGRGYSIMDLVRIAQYDLSEGRWSKVIKRCEDILYMDRGLPEAHYLNLMAVLEVRDLIELEDYRGLFLRKREFRLFEKYGDEERIAVIRNIGKRNWDRERLILQRFRYNLAMTRYNNATSATQYLQAGESFRRVRDFRDSAYMYHSCIEMADKPMQNRWDKILKWFLPYGA